MDIRIPGYEIVREARRGGQGVIFQALQKSTNRKVAVKVLLDGALADEKTLERFRREVDIVAGLRHPHIVAAFDCGETDEGHPYFVMDFVYGQRLNDYVRGHKLSIREILGLFAEICDGVNYAHQRGIIHRDLKPANIIIDADRRPRVLDFGLARRVDAQAQTVTTMAGGVVGTLAYMSPEQVRGHSSEVDIRTDVYSLGVMLYEMIAGRTPYAVDGDLTTAFENITDAEPAPIETRTEGASDAGSRIPPDLETVVFKALAKEPERRYQNAGELGADLRHFLEGEPIDARRDSRMYVIKTALRRHRWAVSAVATFVVLLIAWGVTLSVLYAREQRLTEQIQSETKETATQRDRAMAAESKAKERFGMVREMATDLLFEAHDRVANLAGATPARSLVVKTALAYLEDLQRNATNDPALQREVASGFLRLGNVQGGLGQSNLGDTQAAMTSYERALRLCKAALGKSPGDTAWETLSAEAQSQIGGLLFSQGKSQEALENYQRAMATVRSMLVNTPADAALRSRLANVLIEIGNIHASMWKMAAARREFDEAADIFAELVEADPENAKFRRELAMVQLRIVRVILASEAKPGDAMPFVEKSIKLLRDIVDAHPDSANYARDLSIALDHRADVLMRSDATDKAIDAFRESAEISERLAKLDPANVQAQHDVMISRNDLGRALLSAGRVAAAAAAYQRGLEIAKSLSERDSTSAIFRRDVGHCHDNLASVYAAKDDNAKAIEALTKAIDVYELLLKEDAENFSVLRDAAIAHYNRGEHRLDNANDAGRTREDRVKAVDQAQQDYKDYRKALLRLRDRGRLADFEMKFLDRADEKMATCERVKKELAGDGE